MTTKEQTGVDESDPNNTAGEDSDGAAGQSEEVKGLKAALKAEREKRQSFETKLARVEGTVEGLKSGHQTKQVKEEKIYTRSELRKAVDAGTITEDQMDTMLDKQSKVEAQKTAKETAETVARAAEENAKAGEGIAQYVAIYPDLTDRDSDLRAKVQAEFDELVADGADPDARKTELNAIKQVLGALSANKGRKKTPESHQETGGAGGSHERGGSDDAMFKGVPAKLKDYYSKQLAKGAYAGAAGQKALKAELDVARSRARH